MSKRKWQNAVRRALRMYAHREKYAYFYGCKGEILTQKRMTELWDYYYNEHFKKYTDEEKEQIFRNSEGRYGLDCSGLVSHLTGVDNYSIGFYNSRTEETPNIYNGDAGELLFTTWGGKGRHIGFAIGGCMCVDIAYESTDKRIAQKADSIRLLTYKDFKEFHKQDWEHSFKISGIDYAGTYKLPLKNS